MKTGIACRLLIGIGLLTTLQVQSQPADLATKTDELLTAYNRNGSFSGNVLIAQKGQVLYSKGYGLADYSKNVALTPDTRFRTGSITKQFTATLIMQLAEQGKLDVQAPVSRYLPGFPNGDKITIRHLLTHTSGLVSYTGLPTYRSFQNTALTPVEIVNMIKDKPLEFEPGSRFSYCNSGYTLLGIIAETVSGKPYAQLLEEGILKPAGMTNSGVEKKGVTDNQFAAGYTAVAEKALAEEMNPGIANAAGAIYSTVNDLYKWHQALLTEKIVKQSTLTQMYTPFKNKYGYGWRIDSLNGQLMAAHAGDINGFASDIIRFPASDMVIVVLSNQNAGATHVVAQDLAKLAMGKSVNVPQVRQAIKLEKAALQKFVGKYQIAPKFILDVTVEEDRIFTQATGQPKFEVFPQTEKDFFVKAFDAQLTFNTDQSGVVTEVVLHQNGQDITAKKL